MTEPLDVDKLMAEIEEDVRARRRSGELPADLERELDLVFARYAPVGAVSGDFEQVVARVERSAFIDVQVPVASEKPVVPYVKRALKKSMGWYLNYLAQQVSAYAHASTRAMRILGERVERIEREEAPGAGAAALAALRRDRQADDLGAWHATVAERLGGATGRVAHAEAGNGALVAALKAAGFDAYGVEPLDGLALDPVAGAELRIDEALDHLRVLPAGALGGLVLSGCVDRAPRGEQLELVRLASTRLDDGGTLAVLGTDPSSWAAADPVAADLAPGRPLHAATWAHLLQAEGLTSVEVDERDGRYLVTGRAATRTGDDA